jgi:hypothetical protein
LLRCQEFLASGACTNFCEEISIDLKLVRPIVTCATKKKHDPGHPPNLPLSAGSILKGGGPMRWIGNGLPAVWLREEMSLPLTRSEVAVIASAAIKRRTRPIELAVALTVLLLTCNGCKKKRKTFLGVRID